jgi:hypothetical protein
MRQCNSASSIVMNTTGTGVSTCLQDVRPQPRLAQLRLLGVGQCGKAAATDVTMHIRAVDGKDLCRVHVRPCGFPVEATVTVDAKPGRLLIGTIPKIGARACAVPHRVARRSGHDPPAC